MFEPGKNSKAPNLSEALILLGRDGEIRTHDPLHPIQVFFILVFFEIFII